MRFWERHAEEMRKARILQAAAILYTVQAVPTALAAVKKAFELEQLIDRNIEPKSPSDLR